MWKRISLHQVVPFVSITIHLAILIRVGTLLVACRRGAYFSIERMLMSPPYLDEYEIL
jgi:hypothetical protein